MNTSYQGKEVAKIANAVKCENAIDLNIGNAIAGTLTSEQKTATTSDEKGNIREQLLAIFDSLDSAEQISLLETIKEYIIYNNRELLTIKADIAEIKRILQYSSFVDDGVTYLRVRNL